MEQNLIKSRNFHVQGMCLRPWESIDLWTMAVSPEKAIANAQGRMARKARMDPGSVILADDVTAEEEAPTPQKSIVALIAAPKRMRQEDLFDLGGLIGHHH